MANSIGSSDVLLAHNQKAPLHQLYTPNRNKVELHTADHLLERILVAWQSGNESHLRWFTWPSREGAGRLWVWGCTCAPSRTETDS